MKKYTPYIFPLLVIVIIFFLVYRWYSLRSQQNAENAEFGEGIEIENLSPEEAASVSTGVSDVETAPLEAPEESGDTTSEGTEPESTGTIRYEISGGKVLFSVLALIRAVRDSQEPVETTPLTPEVQDTAAPESTAPESAAPETTSPESTASPEAESDEVSPESGKEYTVYIRSLDGDNLTAAFPLVFGKGGLMGSASISVDLLPVEVIVTDAKTKSEVMDNIILKGIIRDTSADTGETEGGEAEVAE